MKIYDLHSLDSYTVYMLTESSAKNTTPKISAIIAIAEILEHSQYQIFLIDPATMNNTTIMIHGTYLTMDNLSIIGHNFINNNENLLDSIKSYDL